MHLVLLVRLTDLDCREVDEENERPLGRNQKMKPADCLQMSVHSDCTVTDAAREGD